MLLPSARAAIKAPSAPTRYLSPLRYPGAKAKLTPHIAQLIREARGARRLHGPVTLVEPFAGGAGVTLRLLTEGIVDRALIGDADPMLAAFWQVATARPEDLIGRMVDEYQEYLSVGGQTAVKRWDHWRAFVPTSGADTALELAIRCLFLNRTTFSGILHGSAGPIGGRHQTSVHTIDCRYPVEGLAHRIRWIGHLHATGRLLTPLHGDWYGTMETARSGVEDPRGLVAYLDPPYVEKSNRLYATGFEGSGNAPDVWVGIGPHQMLAEYLRTEMTFRWILSYDFHPELTGNAFLYGRRRATPTPSARARGAEAWTIARSQVTLQHSASRGSARREVTELLLTTL